MSRPAANIIVLVILTASFTGCTTNIATDKPTVTQQQAPARVEQLVEETVKAIEPKPRLEIYRLSLNVNMCPDPTGDDPENQISVSRDHYLRDIPQNQLLDISRQVRQYWERQEHLITGTAANGLSIFGRFRPDDLLISLQASGDGSLSLGVSSPCIWPNGTPPPSGAQAFRPWFRHTDPGRLPAPSLFQRSGVLSPPARRPRTVETPRIDGRGRSDRTSEREKVPGPDVPSGYPASQEAGGLDLRVRTIAGYP